MGDNMESLTVAEIQERLRVAVEFEGGIRKWANLHGVSASQTSNAMRGLIPTPPVIAAALGYGVVRMYVPMPDVLPAQNITPQTEQETTP